MNSPATVAILEERLNTHLRDCLRERQETKQAIVRLADTQQEMQDNLVAGIKSVETKLTTEIQAFHNRVSTKEQWWLALVLKILGISFAAGAATIVGLIVYIYKAGL